MWVHRLLHVIDDETVECANCGVVPASYRTDRGKRTIRCSVAVRQQRKYPGYQETKLRSKRNEAGLIPAERDEYLDGKVCEICGKSSPLVVDHCHVTGAIRGPLCYGCNSGIGLLGDNLEGVLRAVTYLQRTPPV